MLQFLLPTMMENFRNDNGNDDIYIYKNVDVSNHD